MKKVMMPERTTYPDRIRNRRVAVLGLARSGVAVCEMLLGHGAQVLASDSGDTEKLHQTAERLRDLGAWVELGGHSTEALLHTDYLVVSPGLKPNLPVLAAAHEKGIPVFSEIEVAFWLCSCDVLALTGTNGKTTTVTLLYRMLQAGGLEVQLAGNVGTPFSSVVGQTGPVVLEVSSYQLEHIETFRPNVAALLNVEPDHLERHGSMEGYVAAKYRLGENQRAGDTFVLNADDAWARKTTVNAGVKSFFFSTQQFLPEGVFCEDENLVFRMQEQQGLILPLSEIHIPGPHNRSNAAAAAAMALAYGVPPEAIADALRKFEGVPHRIEPLGSRQARRFFNDSKATNIGAMLMALRSVEPPIVLLVGGRHKGDDPHVADDLIREKVRAIVSFGEARTRFEDAWSKIVPVVLVDNLEEATRRAFALSRPGDAVVLSPACASFDQFENFEHRGEKFREYVAQIEA
jgi:UDP-N-acetylmuramoylalanine--D-glutamate ligase